MDEHTHHYRKTILLFIVLLIVFAMIFIIAFIDLQNKQGLLGLGIPIEFEDWLIMILCVGSIIKIVWELYIIEMHKQ